MSQRPLALWEKQKGAMRLVELDARAAAAGLHKEQALSDARALVPDLDLREIDRAYLEQRFSDFADWHSNASPIVAVLQEQASYGDLCLDITGVDHLFGGEAAMLTRLTERLRLLGYTVSAAIASSVGTAWAFAHFAREDQIIGDDAAPALADLSVAALRLDDAQVNGLQMMGLKHIGQLYDRDRKAMQARFGASFVMRLDQALGLIEERITPRLAIADRHVEHRFAEPIGLMDDVLMCTHDLAIQLSLRLESEGLGAQSFHLFLYCVDHRVMTLSVNAGRATRDAEHIHRLFVHRAERFAGEYDAGFGIDMIRLGASSVSEAGATQIGAFEVHDGAATLERLYDRMTSRLGPLAVVRQKFIDTHVPERAMKLEPVVARTPDSPNARPDPSLPRPLKLLPAPEPIEVLMAQVPDGPPPNMKWRGISYQFARTAGPERIGIEWWTLPQAVASTRAEEERKVPFYDDAAVTRDYFIAEDTGGRRFWLFREGLYQQGRTPRWYLHGIFP